MESMFTHNGSPRFVFDRRTVDDGRKMVDCFYNILNMLIC